MNKEAHKKQMLKMVKECQESGQTKKDWCTEHQIPLHIFYYWQKIYLQKETNVDDFIPLRIFKPQIPQLRIKYPNDVEILIDQSISPETLRMLINLH
jgi:hypothetical protein